MNTVCKVRYSFHRHVHVCLKICRQSLKHQVISSRHKLSMSVLFTERNQMGTDQMNFYLGRISRVFASDTSILKRSNPHLVVKRHNSARWYCTKTVSEREDLEDLFKLRYIFVRTSVTRWMEFPDGVIFDAGYVDSMAWNKKNTSSSTPVILGIPNVYGDHNELTHVLKPFAKKGYRVIIVNMPGTQLCRGRTLTHDKIYEMSVSEHTEFIRDFLSELNIDRVNMVVTNCRSVYSGVNLCVVYKDIFHSLAMINPPGLQYTKIMNFPNLQRLIAYEYGNGGILEQWLIRAVVRSIKIFMGKKNWETQQVITFCRNYRALSFIDEKQRASQLKSRAKPLLACFGQDSESLDVKSTKEYLSLMGVEESSVYEVHEENQPVTSGDAGHSLAFHLLINSGNILENNSMFIKMRLWNFFKSNYPDL